MNYERSENKMRDAGENISKERKISPTRFHVWSCESEINEWIY
jgi:hypothetical protein